MTACFCYCNHFLLRLEYMIQTGRINMIRVGNMLLSLSYKFYDYEKRFAFIRCVAGSSAPYGL